MKQEIFWYCIKIVFQLIRLLIYPALLIALFIFITSCGGTTAYWRIKNKAGIEKYQYNKPGWPYEIGCQAYYTKQPIKRSTMKRQHYARISK